MKEKIQVVTMAYLDFIEENLFEKIFNRGGYVLDFNNNTFERFFKKFNVDIFSEKYNKDTGSKMNRLRSFWEQEDKTLVGRVLKGLLRYAQYNNLIKNIGSKDLEEANNYINMLCGATTKTTTGYMNDNDFLQQNFSNIVKSMSALSLDIQLENVISQRLKEIELCLKSGAYLSVIFLCGSTLEGLLLNEASKDLKKINCSSCAPKDIKGIKKLSDWTLNSLIDVAYNIGLIKLDTKKFSHVLRDFRNYIHPGEQAVQKFNPDKHTAEISWQVLQATIADLLGKRK